MRQASSPTGFTSTVRRGDGINESAAQPRAVDVDRLLANAYVALVSGDDLASVLAEVAEAARRATRCARVEIAPTGGGPAAAAAGADGTSLVAMLTLPATAAAPTTHSMTFFRADGDARPTDDEAACASRYARVAGLVVHGVAFTPSPAAVTDHQTGAATRAEFERATSRALREARGAVALVVVRVVDLQQVDARFGRDASDEVLRFVTRSLDAAVGVDGVVGRIDRDGLAALVTGARVADVADLVEQLRTALGRYPLPILGRNDVHASIAIGYALNRDSSAELFDDAFVDLARAVHELTYEPRRSRRFW